MPRWSALPTESNAYWHLLNRESFVAYVQKIVIPHVTSLVFREVHPKFVIASLRAFHLPHLAALDLDYNIDHNQTDPRVLLRMLVATARPLLSRLTEFQTSYEMHCHDPDAIARLCEALPNVTHFRLHYWGDLYECEEWWDVLRVQWEHAAYVRAQRTEAAWAPRHRARLGCPFLEIQYGMGLISQSEHDGLKEELDVFKCFEDITPDPVASPPAWHARGGLNAC
ncbi:hypothetical protein C8Q72DRAFT_882785 [Fomitopsis betulina]|nr:hypothetical protein C8Q72DRAFT_882785 [Fomitopsis betulina]